MARKHRASRTTDGAAFLSECFLCRQRFRGAPHRYEARRVQAWDILVCDVCYRGNWDGIIPGRFPHLEEYLRARGIEIELNARGNIELPA
jgi:hypothetical protein